MGILPENIYKMKDASYDELENHMNWLSWRFVALTRVLKSDTGLKGVGFFLQGFTWETLRPFAMKLVVPFDSLSIDLDAQEQQDIKDLINIQYDAGGVDAKLPTKYETKRICKM